LLVSSRRPQHRWDGGSPNVRHQAAPVHHAPRRRGRVAARGSRAAGRVAGNRLHERAVARRFHAPPGRIPTRLGRLGLRRRPERCRRISLGAWRLSPAAKAGHGTGRPTGVRAPRGRRRCLSLGCEGGDLDNPGGVRDRQRPCRGWLCCQPEPAGRQRYGGERIGQSDGTEAAQPTARGGAGRRTGWCPPESELPACRTPTARA
jgi:hypothetical protein